MESTLGGHLTWKLQQQAHGLGSGAAPVRPKPTPPEPKAAAGADPWDGGRDPWAQASRPQTTQAPVPTMPTQSAPTQPTVSPPRLRRQPTPPPEAFDPSVIVRPEGPPSAPSATPPCAAAPAEQANARQLPVPAWVERQAAWQAPSTAPAPPARQWLQEEAPQASAHAPAADAGPKEWLRQEVPQASTPAPAAQPRQRQPQEAPASAPAPQARQWLQQEAPQASAPVPAADSQVPPAPAAAPAQPRPQQPQEAKSQAPPAPRPAPAAQEAPTVQSAKTKSAAAAPGKPLLAVPEMGFQDVDLGDLAQAGSPLKKVVHTFAITVFRATPEQRLGIRVENVRGAGYDSAARVHRIFEGGMIDKWNSTQVANGLPTWVVKVDDVIVGMNGRHEFTPTSAEVRTATMLNLLIVRGLPSYMGADVE
eukprot:s4992_g1.t1